MALSDAERPSAWIAENLDLLRPGGRALDVACGAGRNALFLARQGLRVRAVDRDATRLQALGAEALRLGLPIETQLLDLEARRVDLGSAAYDAIVVVHYLHRPLFPALVRALSPRGVLLYETFTTAQAARGRPTNPAFLLQPGELLSLVAPLRVVRQREGEFEGRMVASVAALRVPRAAREPS